MLHGRWLEEGDAGLAGGMVQEHLVELGPLDLEAIGRPRLPLAEVEGILPPRLLIVKGGPVFDQKAVVHDPIQHTQSLQERQIGGKERLADVEPGEWLPFHEGHGKAPPPQERRGRGAGGTTPNHQHVELRLPGTPIPPRGDARGGCGLPAPDPRRLAAGAGVRQLERGETLLGEAAPDHGRDEVKAKSSERQLQDRQGE
jgi:hypothetical protein